MNGSLYLRCTDHRTRLDSANTRTRHQAGSNKNNNSASRGHKEIQRKKNQNPKFNNIYKDCAGKHRTYQRNKIRVLVILGDFIWLHCSLQGLTVFSSNWFPRYQNGSLIPRRNFPFSWFYWLFCIFSPFLWEITQNDPPKRVFCIHFRCWVKNSADNFKNYFLFFEGKCALTFHANYLIWSVVWKK